MHASGLLLGLAATVSAIDIRVQFVANCAALSFNCINAAPNTCCTPRNDNLYKSIGFGPIPSGWTVDLRGHRGVELNWCRDLVDGTRATGPSNNVCLVKGDFSGGGYSSVLKRRGSESCESTPAGQCTPVRPDSIGMNGTNVDVSHLSDEEFKELEMFAFKNPYDLETAKGKIDQIVKLRK